MERIRELMDDAVAGVVPTAGDPVGVVVRRGQARRRYRAVVAAVLAMVVAGGGLAVSRQVVRHDPPVPTAEQISAAPPELHVEGNEVVAGNLRLPIPAGWRVITAGSGTACGKQARTIVLAELDSQRTCLGEIEFRPTRNRNVGGLAIGGAAVSGSPLTYTVRGGEPAWLMSTSGDESVQPGDPGYSSFNDVVFPWSMVSMTVREDGAGLRKVLESLRSEPPASSALVLPRSAADARLSGRWLRDTPSRQARTKDPKTIAAVLKLLRGQSAVVDDGDACAGESQPGMDLTFSPVDPDTLLPTEQERRDEQQRRAWMDRLTAVAAKGTSVVIALGPDCQEAVSSFGGRVRLTDDAVNELARLLGIAR